MVTDTRKNSRMAKIMVAQHKTSSKCKILTNKYDVLVELSTTISRMIHLNMVPTLISHRHQTKPFIKMVKYCMLFTMQVRAMKNMHKRRLFKGVDKRTLSSKLRLSEMKV